MGSIRGGVEGFEGKVIQLIKEDKGYRHVLNMIVKDKEVSDWLVNGGGYLGDLTKFVEKLDIDYQYVNEYKWIDKKVWDGDSKKNEEIKAERMKIWMSGQTHTWDEMLALVRKFDAY